MKKSSIGVLVVLSFFASVAHQAIQAQEYGKELYELMLKGGLTTTEGNRNTKWSFSAKYLLH